MLGVLLFSLLFIPPTLEITLVLLSAWALYKLGDFLLDFLHRRTQRRSLTSALCSEIDALRERYMEAIGKEIEQVPPNDFLKKSTLVKEDYFAVFEMNPDKLGYVRHYLRSEDARQVVSFYVTAKGQRDALRNWQSVVGDLNTGPASKKEYFERIKDNHSRLLREAHDVISLLKKREPKVRLGKRGRSWLLLAVVLCVGIYLRMEEPAGGWQWHKDTGTRAQERGDFAEAEKRFLAALEIAQEFEEQDWRYAASLNNLALLYHYEGRYTEAEPLLRRAIALNERLVGPESTALAANLNNLALLYGAQGMYTEAEPLYRRALAIWEKALGPEDHQLATGLNNLALLYDNQGKYAQAEPLYQRALAIREKALGPEHPGVAHSLNNLAGLYDAQGKYAQAEPLYRRALAIWEKALGPEDPPVAMVLEGYAALLHKLNRDAEADKMETRAKAIRAKHAQEIPQR